MCGTIWRECTGDMLPCNMVDNCKNTWPDPLHAQERNLPSTYHLNFPSLRRQPPTHLPCHQSQWGSKLLTTTRIVLSGCSPSITVGTQTINDYRCRISGTSSGRRPSVQWGDPFVKTSSGSSHRLNMYHRVCGCLLHTYCFCDDFLVALSFFCSQSTHF